MTGTSVDAVDVALCKFGFSNGLYNFDLIAYSEFEIEQAIKSLIKNIINSNFSIKELSQINFYLSHLFLDCSRKLCNQVGFDYSILDAISVHGQTLWHEPIHQMLGKYQVSSTLQIVSLSALSAISGKRVIGDFRAADIALGGQGAPLVPIFDYNFLKSGNNRVCLNIGGMSNITLLPRICDKRSVIAFDTGPGNVLIDYCVQTYFDKEYDKDGILASKGEVIESCLNELLRIDYISSKPPKSTGRELWNSDLINRIFGNYSNHYDILRTLTEFTAESIAININNLSIIVDELVVSGGGRKNKLLMKILNEKLSNITIYNIDDLGINGDAKEAITFAFLGYLKLLNHKSNIPSVTGATKEVSLGVIAENI